MTQLLTPPQSRQGPCTAFELVRAVQVRRVDDAQEARRWTELLRRHHYLGLERLVGQALRYVAEAAGTWVALIGFSSPPSR